MLCFNCLSLNEIFVFNRLSLYYAMRLKVWYADKTKVKDQTKVKKNSVKQN